jgi:predicted nuclease of predicted toxin-antitoxin system
VSVGLYLDVHVPYAITTGLRLRGIDVLTSQEDHTTQLADPDLLERASGFKRALFTQDRDFLRIASEWQQTGRGFAGIIYGHQEEVTISQCVNDLELIAKVYEPEDLQDRIEYLPL